MVVICTGASNFQVNVSKLRRPLDTVDLEKLPDSRERTGAPVLLLCCEGQIDVWELFSDNSYLSAILDRQGLLVAAPVNLRTKKNRKLLTIAIAGHFVKAQRKESQDRCDVTDCHYPKLSAKKSHMAAVLFVLVRSRISNPWRVHLFSRWDQNQERFGV